MAKAQDVLRIAEGEVGYSRWDDPKPGTKYGRWYESEIDRDDSNYDYGASDVPYCACFTSWVFDQAGAACAGLPGAYCPAMLEVAENAGATVPMMQARPGDVVYFDWNNDGEVDHVGIVAENCGSYLVTIEGNTSSGASGSQGNGGVVAKRQRDFSCIAAVVRPSYGGDTDAPASDKLDVDGHIGPITITKWQRDMGTKPDGNISGQAAELADAYPRLECVTYERYGSELMLKMQEILGIHPATGVIGYGTICYLQGYLIMLGYKRCLKSRVGVLDEYLAMDLQESINDGKWRMS